MYASWAMMKPPNSHSAGTLRYPIKTAAKPAAVNIHFPACQASMRPSPGSRADCRQALNRCATIMLGTKLMTPPAIIAITAVG